MVRRTLTGESHRYTDILGEITHADEVGLVLRTRTGEEIAVPGAEIAIGKPVPPPPVRRPRPAPDASPGATPGPGPGSPHTSS